MPGTIHLGAQYRGQASGGLRGQHTIIEHPGPMNNPSQRPQGSALVEQALDRLSSPNVSGDNLDVGTQCGKFSKHLALPVSGHAMTPGEDELPRAISHQLLRQLQPQCT